MAASPFRHHLFADGWPLDELLVPLKLPQQLSNKTTLAFIQCTMNKQEAGKYIEKLTHTIADRTHTSMHMHTETGRHTYKQTHADAYTPKTDTYTTYKHKTIQGDTDIDTCIHKPYVIGSPAQTYRHKNTEGCIHIYRHKRHRAGLPICCFSRGYLYPLLDVLGGIFTPFS